MGQASTYDPADKQTMEMTTSLITDGDTATNSDVRSDLEQDSNIPTDDRFVLSLRYVT